MTLAYGIHPVHLTASILVIIISQPRVFFHLTHYLAIDDHLSVVSKSLPIYSSWPMSPIAVITACR